MTLAASISSTGPETVIQSELFVMGKSNYKNFLHFHTKFPVVYLLFEKFAMQLLQAGKKKLGSKMIMERIRWEISLEARDDEGFKINNNYTAYYSRHFVKLHPQHEDKFEFRVIRTM